MLLRSGGARAGSRDPRGGHRECTGRRDERAERGRSRYRLRSDSVPDSRVPTPPSRLAPGPGHFEVREVRDRWPGVGEASRSIRDWKIVQQRSLT